MAVTAFWNPFATRDDLHRPNDAGQQVRALQPMRVRGVAQPQKVICEFKSTPIVNVSGKTVERPVAVATAADAGSPRLSRDERKPLVIAEAVEQAGGKIGVDDLVGLLAGKKGFSRAVVHKTLDTGGVYAIPGRFLGLAVYVDQTPQGRKQKTVQIVNLDPPAETTLH